MESLVGHHQLAQFHQQRIARFLVKGGEGPHGQPLDQHLHADDLFVDFGRQHHFGQKIFQRLAAGKRCAPARLDIGGECGDVAGFFPRLVGGVFLCTGIAQDVAERGGKGERPLLPVQDGRKLPARGFACEFDLLCLGQRFTQTGFEDWEEIVRQDHLLRQIERLTEVDIFLVQRIPEMIVGGGDDLVESRGALAVTVNLQHGGEVFRVDGVIGDVFGDLLGHGSLQGVPLRAM